MYVDKSHIKFQEHDQVKIKLKLKERNWKLYTCISKTKGKAMPIFQFVIMIFTYYDICFYMKFMLLLIL